MAHTKGVTMPTGWNKDRLGAKHTTSEMSAFQGRKDTPVSV